MTNIPNQPQFLGTLTQTSQFQTRQSAIPLYPDMQLLGDARYLTVDEVARIAGVSTSTVRNWCRTGELPAFQVRRIIRITSKNLETFLTKNSTEGRS